MAFKIPLTFTDTYTIKPSTNQMAFDSTSQALNLIAPIRAAMLNKMDKIVLTMTAVNADSKLCSLISSSRLVEIATIARIKEMITMIENIIATILIAMVALRTSQQQPKNEWPCLGPEKSTEFLTEFCTTSGLLTEILFPGRDSTVSISITASPCAEARLSAPLVVSVVIIVN